MGFDQDGVVSPEEMSVQVLSVDNFDSTVYDNGMLAVSVTHPEHFQPNLLAKFNSSPITGPTTEQTPLEGRLRTVKVA
jgi:hypothetical protein